MLSGLFLSGITFVFWENYQSNREIAEKIAVEEAENFALGMVQSRNFYASEILPRIRANNAIVTHDFEEISNAFPLPATYAKTFGNYISKNHEGYQARVYSDMPFEWREQTLDEFEKEAMNALRKNPEKPYWRIEVQGDLPVLRYALADRLTESCVGCHNTYIGTPKKDWKVGDVRRGCFQ